MDQYFSLSLKQIHSALQYITSSNKQKLWIKSLKSTQKGDNGEISPKIANIIFLVSVGKEISLWLHKPNSNKTIILSITKLYAMHTISFDRRRYSITFCNQLIELRE